MREPQLLQSLGADYQAALLRRVAEELRGPLYNYLDATAVLVEDDGELMVQMRAGVRSLTWGLTWGLFGYEPDGTDVHEHAELLAIQFDSDAGPGR